MTPDIAVKSSSLIVDEVKLISHTPNFAPGICVLTILFFYSSKKFSKLIIPPPKKATAPEDIWKWKNLVNSLLHSLITGVGSILCFYLHPQTGINMVSAYSPLSLAVAAFTSGYFIFDFSDLLINHRKRSSYELMLHHTFVLSCFLWCVFTRYYLGFGMVGLIVELNSVFLHWRQLLLLSSTPKSGTYFRTVSLINLGTFVVFRIVPLGWMTRWLMLNQELVPKPVYVIGCLAMTCFVIMSIVLFYRLLKADNFLHSHSSSKMDTAAEEPESKSQ